MLYLSPEGAIRLKSFSSTSKGTKATIRIELETDDLGEMAYALASLKREMDEQKASLARKARHSATVGAKQVGQAPALLALPKPRAL